MLATIRSATVRGVESLLIQVEVKVTPGLPTFSVVGLPEGAVREGRERVRAALHQVGMSLPLQRITVNLAPADVRKEGSGFDLPIALGVAAGAGAVDPVRFEGTAFLGELGLDGCLRPVRGVLPVALRCRQEGIGTLVVPRENSREAAVVQGVQVVGAGSLAEVMEHLSGLRTIPHEVVTPGEVLARARSAHGDLHEIRGVETAKRALEVAAAGGHNLLLTGPPGTGKTLLARSLPAILPPLTLAEAVEVTAVHSVAGLLPPGAALVADRPFRAPHASISEAGLVGSGSPPRPGEVSLAHHGVLFLDELPEFRRNATEALRQPLEEGSILISRAQGAVRFPARFMLLAAMNPCPCGFADSHEPGRCECDAGTVRRYRGRVSGPLRDRMDLQVEVWAPPTGRLAEAPRGDLATTVRSRVTRARIRQQDRFQSSAQIHCNAAMGPRDVMRCCSLDPPGQRLLQRGAERLRLSPRAYHRVLKVARTVADLEGAPTIREPHLAEALQYRMQWGKEER